MGELKSLTETARILNRSRAWVYSLYKRGHLPNAVMIGNQIAIPMSDVERILMRQESA
jgi:predicted DNA-binding transcriptional regulator AlpA